MKQTVTHNGWGGGGQDNAGMARGCHDLLGQNQSLSLSNRLPLLRFLQSSPALPLPSERVTVTSSFPSESRTVLLSSYDPSGRRVITTLEYEERKWGCGLSVGEDSWSLPRYSLRRAGSASTWVSRSRSARECLWRPGGT